MHKYLNQSSQSLRWASWWFVGLATFPHAALVSAQQHLPILQYHHVSETTPFSTSVTPTQFKEHMDYLSDAGYQVIDLYTGLQRLRRGESLPDKAVAITFDDAYRNIYEHGFPILQQKGFPFTIFINTQPVESGNRLFLTWEQMREMQKSGGVMANHTVNHPYMTRQTSEESLSDWFVRMQQEVVIVEHALLRELGVSPKMLAYPYGESNEKIRQWLVEQGMIGFGQQSGVVDAASDFSNLPRFPAAGPYADLVSLKTKLAALPMPIDSAVTGGDFAGDVPVKMTLTFSEGRYRLKDLACYVAGQGKAQLIWESDRVVVIRASKSFDYGRGRINCTMPSAGGRSYHWYSHVWIRPNEEQAYVKAFF